MEEPISYTTGDQAKSAADDWPVDPTLAVTKLPLETRRFKTERFAYFVINQVDELTIDRYVQFEKRSIELAFGAEWSFILAQMQRAMNYCDGTKQGSNMAFATLLNTSHGMVDSQSKDPIRLLICTLFILREGEDARTYDPVLAIEKIQDWRESGIAVGFFLNFADGIAIAYNERYTAVSQALQSIPMDPTTTTERRQSLSDL